MKSYFVFIACRPCFWICFVCLRVFEFVLFVCVFLNLFCLYACFCSILLNLNHASFYSIYEVWDQIVSRPLITVYFAYARSLAWTRSSLVVCFLPVKTQIIFVCMLFIRIQRSTKWLLHKSLHVSETANLKILLYIF